MSRVDLYLQYLADSKPLGQIVVFEAENRLLELKIKELQRHIDCNNKSIETTESNTIKETFVLNNQELELRICDFQTKIKLNDILITRINRSIKNASPNKYDSGLVSEC